MSPSDFHSGSHVVELVAGTGSICPSSSIHSASCILSMVLCDFCKNATFQKGSRIKTELCNKKIRGWEYMTLYKLRKDEEKAPLAKMFSLQV